MPDPVAPAWAKLNQIRNEGAQAVTVALAERILEEVAKASLVPSRVVLTADRDIAFVFFGDEVMAGGAHRRVATVTCAEEGAAAMLEDRNDRSQAWDIHLEHLGDTLDRIAGFIAGK